MIAMVEGAARKKTPNEIALQILLVALSMIFLLVTVALYAYLSLIHIYGDNFAPFFVGIRYAICHIRLKVVPFP